MPNSTRPSLKVLLMSEDLEYSLAFTEAAAKSGIEVTTKRTLAELGSIGYLGDCDVLLADVWLGPLQGREVAEYAQAFFPGLPVLLAVEEQAAVHSTPMPEAVVGLFCKAYPLSTMVARVMGLNQAGLITRTQMPALNTVAGAN